MTELGINHSWFQADTIKSSFDKDSKRHMTSHLHVDSVGLQLAVGAHLLVDLAVPLGEPPLLGDVDLRSKSLISSVLAKLCKTNMTSKCSSERSYQSLPPPLSTLSGRRYEGTIGASCYYRVMYRMTHMVAKKSRLTTHKTVIE